ncbi:MAG: tRNA (adenosine(37)-N6)-threonylcarbamoyltransferase complex ATPase subunit type 1 TsaE [Candidatus Saccharibacteria bacterium]|nr:tRNA (adenosine(37)-N6)-threonylcarbamoyltransferase complex ATPase subunit type 1 TsaE [Candidatus Saccharibacteria bacterium]
MQKRVKSHKAQDTEQLAEKIGKQLRGGEIIELSSDLGGGKTTFVRGLARGAGSSDMVASPTFTISKQYDTPSVCIYHYDLYRLDEAGLIAHELDDSLEDESGVVVVEWSEVVAHVLPEKRLKITLDNSGDNSRVITLEYPKQLAYLMEEL